MKIGLIRLFVLSSFLAISAVSVTEDLKLYGKTRFAS